jgi:6-phosphogluconolactonase
MVTDAASARAATVVYVANSDSKEIFVFKMNAESGELAVVEKAPATAMVFFLATSPNRRFLYASLRPNPHAVASFAIDPTTGRLTHLSTVPVPDPITYLVTDRTGRFLLNASYAGNKVWVIPIGPQGVVQTQPSQVIPTQPMAHSVLPDPSNRYVFAQILGGDVIMQFTFDAATGMLSPNTPATVQTKAGAGPRHLVFHPNSRFAYLINELDASVNAYAFDGASGTLTELQSISAMPPGFQGKPWAADIHVTPDGRFLYATERTSSTIAGFKIDGNTGKLTALGNFPTEKQPPAFNIDSRGRFLLVVGQLSHRLTVYAIDREAGTLSKVKEYPVGQSPVWVEVVDLP